MTDELKAFMDRLDQAAEFGIVLRARRTARLADRVGLKPGDARMRAHVGRTEYRNYMRCIRALAPAHLRAAIVAQFVAKYGRN